MYIRASQAGGRRGMPGRAPTHVRRARHEPRGKRNPRTVAQGSHRAPFSPRAAACCSSLNGAWCSWLRQSGREVAWVRRAGEVRGLQVRRNLAHHPEPVQSAFTSMRGHWLLLAGIVYLPSVASPWATTKSADPGEVNFLLRLCQANPQATVPKMSGSPRKGPPLRLCGNGYIEGLINGEHNAFSVWKKPTKYRQWSVASGDPCRDRWRGVYCNSGGRVTSLSLADMNLRELPDPSALIYLESLNLSNNIELLKSAAVPSSAWLLPKLTKLCLNPVGPLDCAMQSNSREAYLVAVQGTRPDPYTAPQSLCLGTDCPSENLNYRMPSILDEP